MPQRTQAAAVLAAWRAVESELQDAADDTPEAEALHAEALRQAERPGAGDRSPSRP